MPSTEEPSTEEPSTEVKVIAGGIALGIIGLQIYMIYRLWRAETQVGEMHAALLPQIREMHAALLPARATR